jgi:hypothetical protein
MFKANEGFGDFWIVFGILGDVEGLSWSFGDFQKWNHKFGQ